MPIDPELKKLLKKKDLKLPTMRADCIYDGEAYGDGTGGGQMFFTFADTTVTVGKRGKEIGTVAGCVGGGIQFTHKDYPNQTWRINPRTLWHAFVKSLPEKKG